MEILVLQSQAKKGKASRTGQIATSYYIAVQ